MKVLLIRPPSKLYFPFKEEIGEVLYRGEPLGLLYMASSLTNDHDVMFFDMMYEEQNLKDILALFQPHVVGVNSPSTAGIYEAYDVLGAVKQWNSEAITVFGGVCATNAPEVFRRDFIDVIVVGEGEITFRELLEAIEERRDYKNVRGIVYRENEEWVSTDPRPFIENLDDLPIINRGLNEKYFNDNVSFLFARPFQQICSSRGCMFTCTFCSIPRHLKRPIRFHSPERTVREIENTKASMIDFVDNDFLIDPERVAKIAEIMKERGIKKERCMLMSDVRSVVKNPHVVEKLRGVADHVWITLGVESANQGYLRKVGKPFALREYDEAINIFSSLGISFFGVFIIFPEFEERDFKELAEWVTARKIAVPEFSVLTPFPGSQIYREKVYPLINQDWRMFDMAHLVVPSRLPKEKFSEHCDFLFNIARARFAQQVMHENVEDVSLDLLAEASEYMEE